MPLVGHAPTAALKHEDPLFLPHVFKMGMTLQLPKVLSEGDVVSSLQMLVGEEENMVLPEQTFDFASACFIDGGEPDALNLGAQRPR
jgi:hypothetical protein